MDWDSDHVELEWTPPPSDGGAPITGYIIQKKERGSPYWQNAARLAGPETKGIVPNLTEGQEYEFRILAVNKVGNSEPSEPSDAVVCRPRHCEYSFYMCSVVCFICKMELSDGHTVVSNICKGWIA